MAVDTAARQRSEIIILGVEMMSEVHYSDFVAGLRKISSPLGVV